jgi:hypothetical protein
MLSLSMQAFLAPAEEVLQEYFLLVLPLGGLLL